MSSSKKDNMLYVGIDLGTSRSVVSASNGNRKWVDSYVGWPKDFVARKMLGKRVLFGSEALEHRLALELPVGWILLADVNAAFHKEPPCCAFGSPIPSSLSE